MFCKVKETLSDYRARVKRVREELFEDPSKIPQDTWKLIKLFDRVDLTPLDTILAPTYSSTGRPGWLPSILFRCLLVALAHKVHSIPLWLADLKSNAMYSAICGFEPGHTPGVGTIYDFCSRLWDLNLPNFWPDANKLKPSKPKIKPPKRKGDKADSVESEDVEQALRRLRNTSFDLENEGYATLLKIFIECFLKPSIENGTVDRTDLRLAGDGTPLRAAARERVHRVCDCKEKGILDCSCPRFHSQPDIDYGWDSSRKCFYPGYDAFFLTACRRDVPLFVILFPASKHDSLSFCETMTRFKSYVADPLGLQPSEILLDSAHDAMPIYQYLHDEGIRPFIDLNPGHTGKTTLQGVTINEEGHPMCPAGLVMKSNGTDTHLQIAKFRCPCMSKDEEGNPICTCSTPCSSAKYGRNFSIHMEDNIRMYNSPPRGSEEWKKTYNSRTAAERTNKREKCDFDLEAGHHRSSMMWYIRTYMAMMLVHLRAWPYEEVSA